MSPEIVVPFMVFGMPVALVFIHKYFKFREKQLEAGLTTPRQLPPAEKNTYEAKQRELEARIENLESALIAMDSGPEHRLGTSKPAGALPERKTPRLPAPDTTGPSD
jgi:hypothetical protein